MREILYPDEGKESVKRHSSIDQFKNFVSAWKKGGWVPVIFDQIDYIGECSGIHSHPVAITFDDNKYVYPEGECVYSSEEYVYTDKQGVEYKQLPECQGGEGELYATWVDANAFTNFDNDTSLGLYKEKTLRVGLDYVRCSESLPPAD